MARVVHPVASVIALVVILIAAEQVPARAILTHQKRTLSRTIVRRSPASGEGSGSSSSHFNAACYSLMHINDFSLEVHPPSLNGGTSMFEYTSDQTVTLTCELTDSQADRSPGQELPYVFINSCRNCSRWIHSEPGRGKTELKLEGQHIQDSFSHKGCQFSCWQYNSTCTQDPNLDRFQPGDYDCMLAGLGDTGLFRTVSFHVLPKSENVTCVSRNWDDLTCTWTLVSGSFWPLSSSRSESLVRFCYGSSPPVNCSNGVHEVHNLSCPIVKSHDGGSLSVSCSIGTKNLRYDRAYLFTFVISTKYGDVIQNHNVFSDRSLSQYAAVSNLDVTGDVANSTKLHVAWKMPTPAQGWSGYVCWLRIEAVSAPWLVQEMNRTVSGTACDSGSVTLTGLHPNVTYLVLVQFRFPSSPFWSDPAYASGNTTQDVPSGAPEVTPGGYVRTSCDTGDCLTVYVKPPLPEFHNGILTQYELEVYPQSSSRQSSREEEEMMEKPSIVKMFSADAVGLSVRLLSTARARACVRVGTVKGFSRVRACLEVPSRNDSGVPRPPYQVTVDYSATNNTYEVRWNQGGTNSSALASSSSSISRSVEPDHYTVAWCFGPFNSNARNEVPTLKCTRELQWEVVSPGKTSVIVSGEDMDTLASRSFTWYFAVASVTGNVSAGLVTSDCTFKDEHGLVQPPYFGTSVKEREITVTWNTLCDVSFTYSRPRRYEIYYADITGSPNPPTCTEGERMNVTPQAGEHSFRRELSQLRAHATYSLCMRTDSAQGGGSEISKSQTVPLKPKTEPEDYTAAIAVPSVVVPWLILLISLFSVKDVLGKRRHFAAAIPPPNEDDIPVWCIPSKSASLSLPDTGANTAVTYLDVQHPLSPCDDAMAVSTAQEVTSPTTLTTQCTQSTGDETGHAERLGFASDFPKCSVDQSLNTPLSVVDKQGQGGEEWKEGHVGERSPPVQTGVYSSTSILWGGSEVDRNPSESVSSGSYNESCSQASEDFESTDLPSQYTHNQNEVWSQGKDTVPSSAYTHTLAEVSGKGNDTAVPSQQSQKLAEVLPQGNDTGYVRLSYALRPLTSAEGVSDSSSLNEDFEEADTSFDGKLEAVENPSCSDAGGGWRGYM